MGDEHICPTMPPPEWRERFETWRAEWRNAQGAGDEKRLDASRDEVEALRSECEAAARIEATAREDAALTSIAGAASESAAIESLLRMPVSKRARFDAAPLNAAEGEPIPEPIIQRAHDSQRVDAVVSIGEPGLLSGAGSAGKSYFCLNLSHAAAWAHHAGAPTGKVCGLEVAAGPVVILSYEYGRRRGLQRMTAIEAVAGDTSGAGSKHVHLVNAPGPLYRADPRRGTIGEGDAWAETWEYVRAVGARLLIIDSGGLALEGASVSEDRPPKVFLRALARESETSKCGVLCIVHSNKAARRAVGAGEDPGADAVSGSVAWFDQARGVLLLAGVKDSNDRSLTCMKANEGHQGWGVSLAVAEHTDGRFGGFRLAHPSCSGSYLPGQVA